jgi:hypothetical protein
MSSHRSLEQVVGNSGPEDRFFFARMSAMPHRDEVVSYSNRFVAFLDILGFRSVVTEIASTSPNDFFHTIVDSYWFNSTIETVNFQLLSDSIIIASKDDEPSSFISVANAANDLRNSFLEHGLLLRGAVSFGKHFQDHDICISPALIEAYELENRSAIYPRILCSQSVIECVVPVVCTSGSGRPAIKGPRGFHVIRDQLPTADFDGVMVVEFLPERLEAYFLRTGHHHDPNYVLTQEQITYFRDVGPQLLLRWRSGLEKAQLRCENLQHKQKVHYLTAKWNHYIQSFKELSAAEKSIYLL